MSDQVKVCKVCLLPESVEEFEKDKRHRDGRTGSCRACLAKQKEARVGALPSEVVASRKLAASERSRRSHLMKEYGITLEQYASMDAEQGSLCAICRQATPGKNLSVDHDHDTGFVRGLLCQPCNFAIGLLEDDMARVLRALAYLGFNGKELKPVDDCATGSCEI